jgi:hypothetical protein
MDKQDTAKYEKELKKMWGMLQYVKAEGKVTMPLTALAAERNVALSRS